MSDETKDFDHSQADANAQYANWIHVAARETDFTLTFGRIVGDHPTPHAAEVMSPELAKRLAALLVLHLDKYEREVGPIRDIAHMPNNKTEQH